MKTLKRELIAQLPCGTLECHCNFRPVVEGRKYLTTVVDSSRHGRYKSLRVRVPADNISAEEFTKLLRSGRLAFKSARLSLATVQAEKSTMWGESTLTYEVPELLLLGVMPVEEFNPDLCEEAVRLLLVKVEEKSTASRYRRCSFEGELLLDWKLPSYTNAHWDRIILSRGSLRGECRRKTCRDNYYVVPVKLGEELDFLPEE